MKKYHTGRIKIKKRRVIQAPESVPEFLFFGMRNEGGLFGIKGEGTNRLFFV